MGVQIEGENDNAKLRYKAWLVVKDFNQWKGVGFDDIFSLIVKMSSIQAVLSIASSLDLEIEKLNVKATFLLKNLQKEIYME